METINYAMDTIGGLLGDDNQKRYPKVMVALSTAKSPWVSGKDTYIDDILSFCASHNAYDRVSGWIQANSETLSMYNPDYIFVVGYEGTPTKEGYQKIMDGLPPEWKRTTAYKEGNIYIFCESAANLASRCAPRFVQLTELTARILHPGSFDDGIEVPKYFGDDFHDYLTYTKDMNFS
jgi:iron complex transport system substrate-binding protein